MYDITRRTSQLDLDVPVFRASSSRTSFAHVVNLVTRFVDSQEVILFPVIVVSIGVMKMYSFLTYESEVTQSTSKCLFAKRFTRFVVIVIGLSFAPVNDVAIEWRFRPFN